MAWVRGIGGGGGGGGGRSVSWTDDESERSATLPPVDMDPAMPPFARPRLDEPYKEDEEEA